MAVPSAKCPVFPPPVYHGDDLTELNTVRLPAEIRAPPPGQAYKNGLLDVRADLCAAHGPKDFVVPALCHANS